MCAKSILKEVYNPYPDLLNLHINKLFGEFENYAVMLAPVFTGTIYFHGIQSSLSYLRGKSSCLIPRWSS